MNSKKPYLSTLVWNSTRKSSSPDAQKNYNLLMITLWAVHRSCICIMWCCNLITSVRIFIHPNNIRFAFSQDIAMEKMHYENHYAKLKNVRHCTFFVVPPSGGFTLAWVCVWVPPLMVISLYTNYIQSSYNKTMPTLSINISFNLPTQTAQSWSLNACST